MSVGSVSLRKLLICQNRLHPPAQVQHPQLKQIPAKYHLFFNHVLRKKFYKLRRGKKSAKRFPNIQIDTHWQQLYISCTHPQSPVVLTRGAAEQRYSWSRLKVFFWITVDGRGKNRIKWSWNSKTFSSQSCQVLKFWCAKYIVDGFDVPILPFGVSGHWGKSSANHVLIQNPTQDICHLFFQTWGTLNS